MALSYVRFSLAENDDLALVLIAALSGDPVDDHRAEIVCDSYIEGSVQWRRDAVRVRLVSYDGDNYRINRVWRRDFLRSLTVEEIAQSSAASFWACCFDGGLARGEYHEEVTVACNPQSQ